MSAASTSSVTNEPCDQGLSEMTGKYLYDVISKMIKCYPLTTEPLAETLLMLLRELAAVRCYTYNAKPNDMYIFWDMVNEALDTFYITHGNDENTNTAADIFHTAKEPFDAARDISEALEYMKRVADKDVFCMQTATPMTNEEADYIFKMNANDSGIKATIV
jgi:hypothetical protein